MALIGLISDVHASPQPVAEAMEIFSRAGVDQILCAGDIAGYMDQLDATIDLLKENNCVTVMGNHDQLYLDKMVPNPEQNSSGMKKTGQNDVGQSRSSGTQTISFLKGLSASYETTIEGRRLYMVHAQPADNLQDGLHGGIKLLDKTGAIISAQVAKWSDMLKSFDYDVLFVGHTHQVFVEELGGTLVINPGSSVFNHCCAILRLPEMTVELFSLSGKDIQKTWNWGEHVIYANT